MANLEKIMAETSKSYDNSRKALNNQINAISGDLAAQQDRINAQYAQQGQDLNNQRNWQAQATSMAASRNGGSFGGASQIANDRYYQQTFVPALTKMYTNRSNDLSSAESQANQRRQDLQTTLAGLEDEARRYAYQRYDAAQEAEREEKYRQQQLALQKQQLAAQNAWQNYLTPTNTATNPYVWSQNGAGGSSFNNANTGRAVTFGTYATGAGAKGNANLMALAGQSLNADEYARLQRIVGAQANTKHSALKTTKSNAYQKRKYLSDADNDFMRRLGLTF